MMTIQVYQDYVGSRPKRKINIVGCVDGTDDMRLLVGLSGHTDTLTEPLYAFTMIFLDSSSMQ